MITNLIRYIKIGDRSGEPHGLHNGLGQGDPFSVIIAIIVVGLEQRVVAGLHPDIRQTAVIDDMTLRGPPESTLRAIQTIRDFDWLAGHETNLKKLAALATNAAAAATLRAHTFGE